MKIFTMLAALAFTMSTPHAAANHSLIIEQQGSFAVGGSVKTSPGNYNPRPEITQNHTSNDFMDVFKANINNGGQTLHGDHASVFYQIPSNANPLPLVFLHGAGQSMRTWQSTPNGREGWNNIFLRKNYAVYLVDQPRRGCRDAQLSMARFQLSRMTNFGLLNFEWENIRIFLMEYSSLKMKSV